MDKASGGKKERGLKKKECFNKGGKV